MKITYKTKKFEKLCTDASAARRKLGDRCSDVLMRRLKQLAAANDVGELMKLYVGRCHALTGDRTGQYAMDLAQPQRLVFNVITDDTTTALIIEIVDYH